MTPSDKENNKNMVNKRTTRNQRGKYTVRRKQEIRQDSSDKAKIPTAAIGIIMVILTNYQAEVKKIFEFIFRAAA